MEIVARLHEVLNMIRDFSAGYSTKNAGDGYMLIQHKGKRYAVKITEIESPSENAVDDLVIMSDHDHRSMHAKYRNKDWDNNAHKPYKYIEVKDILAAAVHKLKLQSYIEEQNI